MEQLLSTFVRSIFVDNMIFAYYLGMCSFVAVSKNVKTALGLGIAVTFVLFCTLPINYMLENYVLKEGALSWLGPEYAEVNLSFLAFIIFIAVIASFVQLVEMVIAVNCAILGGSLFMQQKAFPNVGVATVYGLGSGIGWLLAIVGMAAIREKLSYSNVPNALKGLGITFIITGLMGMAFMCFSGLKI